MTIPSSSAVSPRDSAALTRATRGHGLLEGLLAGWRARLADRLIPEPLRSGMLVDIGCGSYPVFLSRTEFAEKIGLEKPRPDLPNQVDGIRMLPYNLEAGVPLPFATSSVQCVTMLAVFEHITPQRLVPLVSEIRRVLATGGIYVLTTPAKWTDMLLRRMAQAGLVSSEEIDDHKAQYTHAEIAAILSAAGFAANHQRFGYFQGRLNLWATARK